MFITNSQLKLYHWTIEEYKMASNLTEKKVNNLERTIKNIREELELKNNLKFHLNKYILFIRAVKLSLHFIIKDIKLLEEEKKKLQNELSVLENCISRNTKSLIVRMERCDIKRKRQQLKNTNTKQYGHTMKLRKRK